MINVINTRLINKMPETGSPATMSCSCPHHSTFDVDGWEEWKADIPFWHHAVAGSAAGMMEHVAMYPLDTVKGRKDVEKKKLH